MFIFFQLIELTLTEMRASLESDKLTALAELKKQSETEKKNAIAATKKKQWVRLKSAFREQPH